MTTTSADLPGLSPLLIPRPYRVVEKIDEADDVVTLHVVPTEGDLPGFLPAQVGMLGAFGVGEAAISISSPVDVVEYHAYTIRRAGPITNALVDTPVGGIITVRSPFGNSWPLPEVSTGGLLIVAGGLGIAPLRAAIDQAVGSLDRFTAVSLVYGARRPDQLLYAADRDRWEAAGLRVATIVDQAADGWPGPVGLVTELLGGGGRTDQDWSDVTVFVCGPDIMMGATAEALVGLGVGPEHIWLTMERNMQCGNALCGHCQLGPFIVCRDGPVVNYAEIARFLSVEEL